MSSINSAIIDDKSPICIPFILSLAASHHTQTHSHPHQKPLIIGLNGVQGAGKTTLVSALATALRSSSPSLESLVVSIDDFYLPRAAQAALAAAHPNNALVAVRGEPGTHDVPLLTTFLRAVCGGAEARVPRYDKGAYDGLGDRVLPEAEWEVVNGPEQPKKVQVVILEGWCVGFRALEEKEVEAKWAGPSRTLGRHRLEDLLFVNEKLREYDAITDLFDAFIHIDAEDTQYVYEWRLEQEVWLRRERGTGMTDEQVVKFVDAYYPAYELYSDKLRAGIFPGRPGRQLRLVIGKDRRVIEKIVV